MQSQVNPGGKLELANVCVYRVDKRKENERKDSRGVGGENVCVFDNERTVMNK